jgi:CDP-glucose 4,6-dehydratase
VGRRPRALEGLALNESFWKGRKVFVTGHTGFKGAWLSLWLAKLGAHVTGYALPPPTDPNLHDLARLGDLVSSLRGDIRDRLTLGDALSAAKPEIVFHLAAQSLVRESYRNPLETYEVNALGTANLLEAIRSCSSVRAAIVATSDKCYDNREKGEAFREGDPLGGRDPYSSSKACAELVASAYRASYFAEPSSALVATVRAGNVIGGGDWAADRLVPDIVRAIVRGNSVTIRNPESIRPWQHVLDPLAGYLLLAERLWGGRREEAAAWNFGPDSGATRQVGWLVEQMMVRWGAQTRWKRDEGANPHEADTLVLDSSKARRQLGWLPKLDLAQTVANTVDWYRAVEAGSDPREVTLQQLRAYAVQ